MKENFNFLFLKKECIVSNKTQTTLTIVPISAQCTFLNTNTIRNEFLSLAALLSSAFLLEMLF